MIIRVSGNNLNATDAIGTLNLTHVTSTLNSNIATFFFVGHDGTSAVTVSNLGLVTASTLDVGNGSSLTLHGGDTISTAITLTGGSNLAVDQTNGTGLTFGGASASSLTIDPSTMSLIFTQTGWDFRWQDPATGGNWVSTLDGLIGSGAIVLSLPAGDTFKVTDSVGYTYISAVAGASVPEPSSLVLAGLAVIGVTVGVARRRRRTDQ